MDRLETLNEMLRLIKAAVLGPDEMMLDELGYDAGFNGANPTNCNFRLFDTKEHSEVWSKANKRGLEDRRKARESIIIGPDGSGRHE